MLRYVLERLLGAIPTLFLIVTISFFLIRIAPGGPFDLERPLEAKVMENLNRIYHLDEPLWNQYLIYLKSIAVLDFGPSFYFRDFSINELFAASLPISMQLGLSALALALVVGGVLGVVAALRQNHGLDYSVMAAATLGVTIPNFVLAPVMQLLLGVHLGWLPVGGWAAGNYADAILPVVTLALPQIAVVARLTRGSMIEALRSNHVRTARAYGLSAYTVIVVHALRGALLPVVSYLGPAAAALLTGSVVVETIFGIPGIGRYFVQGALNRDYTLVMGTVVIVACFVILFNLVVDLLYALLDPRVRFD
ncbi:oligopeptide ABC transporter permease OppB [Pannonibacter indicus]|jgi:oligopeptide transport system permease protein|uniref:ABC-type dipeptide/oligopeptide/nickel transport system, permease component n=1 Tax=Pannonibacter indicus TaxID=466044 RepID=A0A0K6I2W0_9HYPH|nr:oligopeptide ABC transporter permease OppB [Pannonibacter indicus]CUA97602.1 ABC-type dipeptide/oligopeptide/nickel transport system, permease component [Pannonibacter indicus]